MAFYLHLFINLYKYFYLFFICTYFNRCFPAPNHHCSFIICADCDAALLLLDNYTPSLKFYFILDILLHSSEYLLTLSGQECGNNIHFLVIVKFLALLWVVQYPKNINFKLLIFKDLYGCYSRMVTMNGYIQRSFLLVYSLKMVTGKYNQNISIFS